MLRPPWPTLVAAAFVWAAVGVACLSPREPTPLTAVPVVATLAPLPSSAPVATPTVTPTSVALPHQEVVQAQTTYRNPVLAVGMTVPQGWLLVRQTEDQDRSFFYASHRAYVAVAQVELFAAVVDAPDPLAFLLERFASFYAGNLAAYEELDRTTSGPDGLPTATLDYSYVNAATLLRARLRLRYVNGYVLALTAVATEDRWLEVRDQLLSMLGTVTTGHSTAVTRLEY